MSQLVKNLFQHQWLQYEDLKIKPWIFGQHRCHSIYISFGGDKSKLIDELLGKKTGCNRGMGGSASISSKEINMFGQISYGI